MPTGWTASPAAASSTLEEWTRTFSRGQQCSCFRTRNTFCRTRSMSNATFSLFDHVMKIWWFFTEIWRYINFQNGGVRHLGIVLPPYETTHEVPVKFYVNVIHRMIWRYSCLNFSHIWLEMPIHFLKIGVLGDFVPLTVTIHHRNPKRHILV